MRNTVILTALLLGFSMGAASCRKSAPDPKYKAAIDSLQELQSARLVGMNQRDFGIRVLDLKIKVDKLGYDPKYIILKKATQMMIDANTMWRGSIVGSLPRGTLQEANGRYAKYPHVLGPLLSKIEGDDASSLHGIEKQAWGIWVGGTSDVLFFIAQQATAEALGQTPAGSFASEMATREARLQKQQDAEQK
jgi:hypothetical protein